MSYIYTNPNPNGRDVGNCTVRDHIDGTIRDVGGNEFLDSCNGCDKNKFFDVMSEHFDTIKKLHPKEYNAVIERLSR